MIKLYNEISMLNNSASTKVIMLFVYMGHPIKIPTICIIIRKQRRGNCTVDQFLCLLYTDSAIPHLLKSQISSFQPSPMSVKVGLCQTWSETSKTVFSHITALWYVFFRILPPKCGMLVLDILGANNLMDTFRGRAVKSE